MRKALFIMLSGIFCALTQPMSAQIIAPDSLVSDTLISIANDTLVSDSMPEWYVAPEIPLFLRAPKHTAAAKCMLDSIMTFDIDSVLVECTCYEYDNAGRTINQEVWTYNPDGSRIGKSKNEYCYSSSGDQTCTAVYTWDNTANTWKGTERFEYVYKSFSGQKKLISSTSLVWINGAWVADKRYTYNYDAAVREIEYFEYRRNTTTNELEPYKGRVQTWIDNTLKSIEEQYTTYSNGAWNAGTKKEWAYDAEGRQTLYTYYGIITNGNWVGSSKETWEYGGPEGQQTKYEKFGWYNNDWSMTKREIAAFDAESRQILVENYTGANGVETGVKKEEYTFDSNGIKTMTVAYAWSNGAWVGSTKETWEYNGPNSVMTKYEKQVWSNSAWIGSFKETWTYGGPSGQLTLHEKYGWANNDWSLTLQEKTVYSGANITLIENYSWTNGVKTGTKKEEYTYSGSLKTSFVTYSWAGSDWVGASKEIWAYTSGKQTLHETYAWGATDWSITLQEKTVYSGANITLIENYSWTNGVKTGTQKETYNYTNGKKTEAIIYAWENNAWIGSNREVWAYNASKLQTLHEKYEWVNDDWTIMVQEKTAYSGSNISSIENYERVDGVWTGTQKEEYAYISGKKTSSIVYAWANDIWVESSKEVWGFTSGKQTLYETYAWDGSWVMTLQENTVYDGNNITKIENYSLVGDTWTGTKKEEYTYEDGTKTKTITSKWSNGAWVFSTKNEIGYQEGNTKVSEANYTWNGSMWTGTGTLTRTTYDENNREIEVLKLNWPTNATEWTYSTRTVNTYNADGIKILSHSTKWKNDKWVLTSMTRIDIIKDNEGRTLLNASWKCSSDSVWKGVQKDTTYYSATGNWLFDAHYASWKNNKWVLSYKKQRIYDDADRLVLDERYNWKNNTEVGDYRYEYEYDADGRQIMTTSYSGWNSVLNNWIGNSKRAYTYDANGRIESEITYTWEDGDWAFLFAYHHKYDASGREIEQVVQQWLISKWINTEKQEKEYLGSKLIKDNVYHWISKQWQLYNQYELYYDADSQAKLRREIVGEWDNNAVLQSYSDNHYAYSCDPCIIRFVNYDGTELESKTMDKGLTPSYTGETPTRPEDAEYTYTFLAWTPAIVSVTGNATYTATFKATKRSYTITWLNDNDTQIDQTTVEYGVMPTHADPTKTNTAEFTYTFTGWTPGIGVVTGDASYKATFSATKNKYLVVFQDEGGAELQSGEVEYGTTPEFTGVQPGKEATAQYTYAFAGWEPEITAVNGAQTYTAKYSSTVNKYTIKWLNDDESELQISNVEYGTIPTYDGETPHKDADEQYTYTFAGWDQEIVSVTGEATYKATYSSTTNQYTVKFVNYDGDELQSSSWNYGASPSYSGETPTKPADDENNYTFEGWSPVVTIVTKDATYTATYTKATNEYTITWYNDDNTLIDQTTVAYGVVPTHDDPTKENTAEWTYTFSGWDHEPVAVTGNASYKATYNATKNKYLVVFQDEGGAELQSGEVEFGTTPEFTGAEPSKEATAQYTYAFAGWDPEITAVEGAQTYTAKYSSTVNKYTIKWLNDDESELQISDVEYGTMPTYDGESPHKDADAQYTYTFAGWDQEIVSVTGEATYKATYSSTTNQYTIKFVNYNGDELQSSSWNYGATPSYSGEVPTKPADNENHYAFLGWSPVITIVTKDATYTATYSETTNEYTISWFNDDNTLIDQTTVAYGVVPTHEDPTKENNAEWTYTFSGWDHEPVAVTGAASYKATYNATKNKYTITWKDDEGKEIGSDVLAYGETPQHEDLSKENTAEWTYTFTGWAPTIESVKADASYQATFSATKNSYTITWLHEDGSELSHETLEYGVTPQHEDLSKENTAEWTYTFTGWTPAIESVEADASYQATFSATKNSYTITWLNEDGSEIEHETLVYGITPSHADIYKESTEEFTYTFIGWTPSIVPVNGDAAYKAVFEATPVDPSSKTFTITFLHDDGITILEQVTVEYDETPVCRYTPTKMGDAEHYYTFVGWSPEIVPATANASYTPIFELVARQYVITFKNYDGKVLQTAKVDYGAIPEYTGATPTRNGTTQYAYVFTGWTPELAPVTKEATYKATFERTARIYTVIYYDEDGETELDRVEVAYGQMPHTSVVPTKEEDEEYYYVFIGWTPYVTFVTKDASYSALFQKKNKLEGIEDVESEEQAVKIFKNNILYILRAGKIYTVDGKLVEEY